MVPKVFEPLKIDCNVFLPPVMGTWNQIQKSAGKLETNLSSGALLGKELVIRFTLRVFRGVCQILCVSFFPFWY